MSYPDDLVHFVAAGMYAQQPGNPDWATLLTWADGSAAACVPGTIGWKSAQVRGEKPFAEARQRRDWWLACARAALERVDASTTHRIVKK